MNPISRVLAVGLIGAGSFVIASLSGWAASATYQLEPLSSIGGVAEFDLKFNVTPDPGHEVVYFAVDVSASSPLLTLGGTDFSAFSFTKSSPLLDNWARIPGSNFGASPFSSYEEFETAGPGLGSGAYSLGRLRVDFGSLVLDPKAIDLVSLAGLNSVMGTEMPSLRGTFGFHDITVLPHSVPSPIPETMPLSMVVSVVTGILMFARATASFRRPTSRATEALRAGGTSSGSEPQGVHLRIP